MPENDAQWLTVRETAERLGQSEATIRRMIRAHELPASRQGRGSRAPWMVNAAALERRRQIEAHRKRMRESGVVVGYSDEGGPADEAFPAEIDLRHGADTAANVRAVMDRRRLFERVEREMYADSGVRHRLERLDEAQRFEEEARELAARIRRVERLRDRALEILDEEADAEGTS
jgi:excisionase family DNA binding protein